MKLSKANAWLGVGAAALISIGNSAVAQLAGPPGGVPVPPAPIASDTPTREPAVAVPAGSLNFRVRLLDGRNGLPLKAERVRLWYDEASGPGYLLTTDAHGEALMPEPAVEPVRILAQPESLFDCRKSSLREPAPGYNLKQTAEKGMFGANRCEAAVRATPHPGELTLFARPLRWYEQVNRP